MFWKILKSQYMLSRKHKNANETLAYKNVCASNVVFIIDSKTAGGFFLAHNVYKNIFVNSSRNTENALFKPRMFSP
jgi:HKD family nuclease